MNRYLLSIAIAVLIGGCQTLSTEDEPTGLSVWKAFNSHCMGSKNFLSRVKYYRGFHDQELNSAEIKALGVSDPEGVLAWRQDFNGWDGAVVTDEKDVCLVKSYGDFDRTLARGLAQDGYSFVREIEEDLTTTTVYRRDDSHIVLVVLTRDGRDANTSIGLVQGETMDKAKDLLLSANSSMAGG